jgi:hypothetical protein
VNEVIKKYKRRKAKGARKLAILAGVFLILLAFVFSLRSLISSPIQDQEAQEQLSHQAFIDKLVPHAQELQAGYGVLPSIILGQAILESDWGNSTLASKTIICSVSKLTAVRIKSTLRQKSSLTKSGSRSKVISECMILGKIR